MRWVLLCGALFLFPTFASADVIPECPEGQMADCNPTEMSHGCGGCIDDPSYEGSGCSVAAGSGGSFLLALGAALLLRRRRE